MNNTDETLDEKVHARSEAGQSDELSVAYCFASLNSSSDGGSHCPLEGAREQSLALSLRGTSGRSRWRSDAAAAAGAAFGQVHDAEMDGVRSASGNCE